MIEESGPRFNPVTAALLAGLGVLSISQVYTVRSIHTLDARLASVSSDLVKARGAFNAAVLKLNDASSTAESARAKTLAALRAELEKTKANTAYPANSRAGEEALGRLQDINARIVASEQTLRETQVQVAAGLNGVRQAADSANTNVAAVSTEVREVKDDVASARNQLNSTIADLHRVTGDLGLMSGLIATNGREIGVLKQLGDRNYSEFTVNKTKDPVRIGDVLVVLKKVDTGRNTYTVELCAEDRKIEKKDRTVNEPVQFYVGGNRQPYELVVNRVQKNQIVGYLATPKVGAVVRP